MASGKTASNAPTTLVLRTGPVVKAGHLKKLKTLRKKYFILREEGPGHPACLEYYDSKKKYESKQAPKRCILLKTCFNINKRRDTKHKNVIALYTKDDCFCVILDNENEMEEWLNAMLLLQNGADQVDGARPRPIFEHVWQISMQKRGLGEKLNIVGPYRLCLTDKQIDLVKLGVDAKDLDTIEFPLHTVRRCGYMDRIFYIEIGRSAVTGNGEFWMETEDSNTAQNMHHAINNAMTNNTSKDEVCGPQQRMRSSSANEASKPISVLQRRHTGQKLHGFSPLGSQGRDRCDSLPSRARTTSEGHNVCTAPIISHSKAMHLVSHATRPHSMHSRGLSYSPPVSSMPISPASGACSTDSAGSSLSMDDGSDNVLEEGLVSKYGHSLTPDEPVIIEENGDDYVPWAAESQSKYSPNFRSHSPVQSSYMEMCSPCSSSPGRGGYMPMSPATTGHSHSRTSSLAEDNSTLHDGYVPMAPSVGDDGYVDMDPSNSSHNGHFPDDMSQHGGSSCSVTSGTPSTDLRFSEYHLDKVTSFLAPGEDLQGQARPTRAYSVGSRPEPTRQRKNSRLDFVQQEVSRVRAFSVGSRYKRPEIGRLTNVITAPLVSGSEHSHSSKSSSAPMLSSSWGHNSGCSVNSDRMEDLMEFDFTRPAIPVALSSPPSTYSQLQSNSTATDTSSYVDMSPGHLPIVSTTSSNVYVDMNGQSKANHNNNNNNNIVTANHNHNHNVHTVISSTSHKPVVTMLKPVQESESSYMRVNAPPEDWSASSQNKISPATQLQSPVQSGDYMEMNGPPGVTRTAPVDFPQPRRPPEGYVEMSFKTKHSLEQEYMNMSLGINRNNRKYHHNHHLYHHHHHHHHNGSRKKNCSLPIAIQASKSSKVPNFLPLNGSPASESLDSTPASPPQATPTSSAAVIFPFSLNSPQSPVKPFTSHNPKSSLSTGDNVISSANNSDYAVMTPSARKNAAPSPLPGVDGCPSSKKPNDKQQTDENTNPMSQEPTKVISNALKNVQDQQLLLVTPLTKKLSDLTVSKPRLVTASPTSVTPTPTGFKPVAVQSKPTSPKLSDDSLQILTPTTISTTSAVLPKPLDSEGYEKLQPGASLLHYASLDLKEASAPVSPIPVQEGFPYAEIDFAKLKQN